MYLLSFSLCYLKHKIKQEGRRETLFNLHSVYFSFKKLKVLKRLLKKKGELNFLM